MSLLVEDCPRCHADKISFDIKSENYIGVGNVDWLFRHEIFCVCRNCRNATIFVVELKTYNLRDDVRNNQLLLKHKGSINGFEKVLGFINLRDMASEAPPEYLPIDVSDCFNEAATCLAAECWNAAGTMFRMCVDLATRPMLPEGVIDGLNAKIRRDLGLRLPWLFDNNVLPEGLRELSKCIREDGNDGAHAGTLEKEDAHDLLDFTRALLERIFTEPEKLKLAEERRKLRRGAVAQT